MQTVAVGSRTRTDEGARADRCGVEGEPAVRELSVPEKTHNCRQQICYESPNSIFENMQARGWKGLFMYERPWPKG